MWKLDCQNRDLDCSSGRLLPSFAKFLFTCCSVTRFLLDPCSVRFSSLSLPLARLLGRLLFGRVARLLGRLLARLLVWSSIGLLDHFLVRALNRSAWSRPCSAIWSAPRSICHSTPSALAASMFSSRQASWRSLCYRLSTESRSTQFFYCVLFLIVITVVPSFSFMGSSLGLY